MSKTTSLYHIVFCTKFRENTIPEPYLEDLYRFIWKEIKSHDSTLVRIGGIENHVHMLINLNPNQSLSAFMRDIKSCSSGWMKNDSRFCNFKGWAPEYYACSCSPADKDRIINYIASQKAHHGVKNFDEELTDLYSCAGIEYDPRDLQ